MACFLSPLQGSDAFVGRCPSDESLYLFSEVAAQANGARTLVRRNVTTAQTRPQNSNASFAHQRSCGLKSALRRSVARATTTLNTHESLGYYPSSLRDWWLISPCQRRLATIIFSPLFAPHGRVR